MLALVGIIELVMLGMGALTPLVLGVMLGMLPRLHAPTCTPLSYPHLHPPTMRVRNGGFGRFLGSHRNFW